MNNKAVIGLTAGALVVGLFAGLALGNGSDEGKDAVGPGPTKTVSGVPVGYTRTRSGAVAAATAYSRVISSLTLVDEGERDRTIALMGTESARTELQAKARSAFAIIDKGLGLPDARNHVVLRSAAVGYKVVSFTPSDATVDLWIVDVVGKVSGIAPQAGWGVSTFNLKWEVGDWKLVSFPSQVPGPSPVLQGTASTVDDLARIIALAEIPNGSAD